MSAWIESASQNFVARHEERDQRDVAGVLDLLEDTRERLGPVFGALPDEVVVVLHPSSAQLDLAQPFLPVVRRLTTPAARRYVAGWAGRGALHTLAPRQLAERAANVEGSREVLALTPAALYVQLVVAENNPALPPPWMPRSTLRARDWAWLIAGAGQWFSGQTGHARPAIARRLREDARPDFPPGLRDAALLGGTLDRPRGARAGRRGRRRARRCRGPGGRRPARGAAGGVQRPRDGPHRGHVARAPVAHGARGARRHRQRRAQIARMRLLRGLCSTSARPSSSMSGGMYIPKRPR